MSIHFVPVCSYEQAEELFHAGLLYANGSICTPRNSGWGIVQLHEQWMLTHVKAALLESKRDGTGWWATDFAYAVED